MRARITALGALNKSASMYRGLPARVRASSLAEGRETDELWQLLRLATRRGDSELADTRIVWTIQ